MSTAASSVASPVLIHDESLADHLYRLAQEAVTNAIKHGRAKNITIGLAVVKGGGVLDDSRRRLRLRCASTEPVRAGLRIMNYRAKMIGGSLSIQSSSNEGTMVRCSVSDYGASTETKMALNRRSRKNTRSTIFIVDDHPDRAAGTGAADQSRTRSGGVRRRRGSRLRAAAHRAN